MASPKLLRRTAWAGAVACWGVLCLSTGLCCLPSDPPPKQSPDQQLMRHVSAPAPAGAR